MMEYREFITLESSILILHYQYGHLYCLYAVDTAAQAYWKCSVT